MKRLRLSVSGGTDADNFAFAASLGHLLTQAGLPVESKDLERMLKMSDEEWEKASTGSDNDPDGVIEIITISNPPV